MEPAPLKTGLFDNISSIIKSTPWVNWLSTLVVKPALTPPGDVTLFLRGDDTWQIPGGFVPGAHAASHAAIGSDPVDHDTLSNFVINEHIDHSSITITGEGLLSGQGGDLTVSRVFTLNNIDIDHDQLTNAHNLTTDIDHDALTNFVADEHIDWTGTTESISTTGDITCDILNYTSLNPPVSAGSPGGSSMEVQFNNAGVFDGTSLLTVDLVNSYIELNGDLETDRWLNSDTNVLLGVSVVGAGNLAHGSGDQGWYNTIIGYDAASALTTGYNNVILGSGAMAASTTSIANIAIGRNALSVATICYYNIAIGYNTLSSMNSAAQGRNVAVGSFALEKLTSASDNTALGYYSLKTNVTGRQNTALGSYALEKITNSYNTAVGYSAGRNIGTGIYNCFFGNYASGSGGNCSYVVSMGYYALQTSTRNYNIGIGYFAGYSNYGSSNVLIGFNAGYDNTSDYNVIIGNQSGKNNNGQSNVILGNFTGYNNVSTWSVLIGDRAGYNNTGATKCVLIGYYAGYGNTTTERLIIENSNDIVTPLIDGSFADDWITINGYLTVASTVSNALTIGAGTADIDYNITFNGETNDGVLTWMEDEDYFKFDDDVLLPDNESLILGTGADMDMYYDGTDGYIRTDLVAASDLLIDCGTDKTIELQESVWEDLQFAVSGGKVPASNAPTWEALTTNTSEYSFDVDDYKDLDANELMHSWKEGTDGNFHAHIAIKTAQSSGADRFVKFIIYVAYVNSSSIWTETSLTAEKTIPDGSSAIEEFYLDMGDVSFAGLTIGTQVKVRVKRIAATGGTEYSDNIFITQIGCHLEQNTMGSRQEVTK